MDEQNIEKRKNWVLTTPKPTLARSILKLLGIAYSGEEISIETNRQQAEIISALTSNVVFYSWWLSLGRGGKGKYTGRVTDRNFKIKWQLNSSALILYGSIKQTSTGSKIKAYLDIDPIISVMQIGACSGLAIEAALLFQRQQTMTALFNIGIILLVVLSGKLLNDAAKKSVDRIKLLELLERITTSE